MLLPRELDKDSEWPDRTMGVRLGPGHQAMGHQQDPWSGRALVELETSTLVITGAGIDGPGMG